MIVEDEILVALDLEATLEDFGYEPVGIAADLKTALALVKTEPTVALVDLNLRDGPTGSEIGARLARDHGIKVLFLTANPLMLGKGVAGTVGVLTKPCWPDAVRAAIEYALCGDHVEPPSGLIVFPPDDQPGRSDDRSFAKPRLPQPGPLIPPIDLTRDP